MFLHQDRRDNSIRNCVWNERSLIIRFLRVRKFYNLKNFIKREIVNAFIDGSVSSEVHVQQKTRLMIMTGCFR